MTILTMLRMLFAARGLLSHLLARRGAVPFVSWLTQC